MTERKLVYKSGLLNPQSVFWFRKWLLRDHDEIEVNYNKDYRRFEVSIVPRGYINRVLVFDLDDSFYEAVDYFAATYFGVKPKWDNMKRMFTITPKEKSE